MVTCALAMYALCSASIRLFVYLSYFYFLFSDDDRLGDENASMRERIIRGLTLIVSGAEEILHNI